MNTAPDFFSTVLMSSIGRITPDNSFDDLRGLEIGEIT